MTLLDDPPVATAPVPSSAPIGSSSLPAWRFASRLARREVRRRPGRTLLASLLIAVPVAAMTLGSVIARTDNASWADDFQRDYGDTDIVVNGEPVPIGGSASDSIPLTALPSGTTTKQFIWFETEVIDERGDGRYVAFGNMPFDDVDATAGVKIVDGQPPDTGEVLIGRRTAEQLDLDVGDMLTLQRPSGSWQVAGIGELRRNYEVELLIIPGFDASRVDVDFRALVTLIDVPDDTPGSVIRQFAVERGAMTRSFDPYASTDDLGTGMAWGFVAGVLALVAVGIIVAAAFATSARRQLVTIGQLSSNGAPANVIQRTLSLQGTWTGLVGAILGIAGSLALLPLARSLISRHIFMHEMPPYRFSLVDLIVISVTAIVAATVAAGVPARSAARIPVMAALAGRRPAGTPARWLVPTGLALLAGGLSLVAVAATGARGDGASESIWALLIIIGVTAMVFGMCCAAPLVVERLGSLGRRASLSWRLALRSLVRSRTRSAAVVAAIAVAVGGATAAAAIADAGIRNVSYRGPAVLPADAFTVSQYTVWGGSTEFDSGYLADLGPLKSFNMPAGTMSLIGGIAPEASIEPYLTATFDPSPFDSRTDYNDATGPTIATPAILDLLGVSARDRQTLGEVGTIQATDVSGMEAGGAFDEQGRPLPEDLRTSYRAEGGEIVVPFALSADPLPYSWFGLLMTEEAAVAAGFEVVQAGVVVRTGAPLTATQLDQLRELQKSFDGRTFTAFIEPGDPPRTAGNPGTSAEETYSIVQYDDPRWTNESDADRWLARLIVVAAALLLSLLVVSIGLSLAAAEGREERDTFSVIGARPSSMRRQAAARAAVLSLVGIGLGIPLGFAPPWIIDRFAYEHYDGAARIGPPWLVIGALLLIIPLVAAGAAWTASGLAQRFRPATPTRRD